jgi:hypothetical protein
MWTFGFEIGNVVWLSLIREDKGRENYKFALFNSSSIDRSI